MRGAQTPLCLQGPQNHPCRKQEAQLYCDTGLCWLGASGTQHLQQLLRCKAWQWDAPGCAPASPGLHCDCAILRLHILLSYCKSQKKNHCWGPMGLPVKFEVKVRITNWQAREEPRWLSLLGADGWNVFPARMSRRWVSKQGYPAGGYPAPITKMGEPAGGGGIAGGTTSRLKAYREQGKG